MALGADGSDVRRLILRGGLKTTVIGSTLGLAMALPLPKLFDAIFLGLHTGAPVVYLIVLTAMLIVAAVATYIRAQRAARVSPVSVLRNQ
jgi:ABC-type lipoprotein release transport system permease subunit